MRKIWVPKEALIPKPFYKRKLFVFFCLLLISSIFFLAYQLYFVNQLPNSTEMLMAEKEFNRIPTSKRSNMIVNPNRDIVKGTRIRDIDSYIKIYTDQRFQCLDGNLDLPWEKLNDNFCDCPDGSDETFTNACSNGKFYCTKQLRHKTGRGKDIWVPTSRINDGVCDCELDCSDEYKIINK